MVTRSMVTVGGFEYSWEANAGLWRVLAFGRAITSAPRRLDHEDITSLHLGLVARAEAHDLPARPDDRVAADHSRLAARHAVRRNAAVSRQDRRGHRLQKRDVPHGAGSAPPPAGAAAAQTYGEFIHQHRETPFQQLRFG